GETECGTRHAHILVRVPRGGKKKWLSPATLISWFQFEFRFLWHKFSSAPALWALKRRQFPWEPDAEHEPLLSFARANAARAIYAVKQVRGTDVAWSRFEFVTPPKFKDFTNENLEVIKNRDRQKRLAASRTELIDSLLSSFRTLVDFIGNQLRTTGERLDEATKKIDERVEGIGLKLSHDLDQMDSEAHRNRDALRKVIEDKLDDSIRKQNLAAHDLREEMNSSFEQLGNRVSNTLTQNSTQQKERLEDTMTVITTLTDKHEKAQESLKQAVEGKLDSIRQESWEKLDEMRRTVDEQLQTTLEKRLTESFSTIAQHLNQLYEGLGEMKTLAANVGNLNNALTNVKVRGIFGEVQLSLLIEEFLTIDQYVKNASVKD